MSNGLLKSLSAAALVVGIGSMAQAQQTQVAQYGPNVNLEQARKVISSAMTDARRQNLPMAVAVVDTSGRLVAFERMDNTQTGSIDVALDKAVSSAMFKRPTKAFQDALAGGGAGLLVLTARDANAIEGGLPLVVDGKIVGGVGVSGGAPNEDGVAAEAGAKSLSK